MWPVIIKLLGAELIRRGAEWIFKGKEDTMFSFEGKKTYVGLIVAVLPFILKWFGIEITDSAALESLVSESITVGGVALAAYGRAVATAPGVFAKKK